MNLSILLAKFCDENGYTFYPDYSGRCMYGSTCIGIGIDSDTQPFELGLELAAFAAEEEEEEEEEVCDLLDWLGRSSMDSMGMGYIIYFPGVAGN